MSALSRFTKALRPGRNAVGAALTSVLPDMAATAIPQVKLPFNPLPQSPEVRGFASFSRSHYAPSHSDPSVTFPRVTALKERLAEEDRLPKKPHHRFKISVPGRNLLRGIRGHLNERYSRGGKSGEGYVGVEEALAAVPDHYEKAKVAAILRDAEPIQEHMRTKISEPFLRHGLKTPPGATKPNPILQIVMPDHREIEDLSGEIDPSNQNRYSPLPGLLHKYEMLLALVAINCSSHCRYCYRLDLFNGSSNKSKADMELIAAYISTYNEMIAEAIEENGEQVSGGVWVHKTTREPLTPVKEILFSGGDPMTLPNATLARYMVLMAEAGITNIRIGTKEMSFNPGRFDARFFEMMDRFHETYPDVHIDIVGHYSHPFELVEAQVDDAGEYVYDITKKYRRREDIKAPIKELQKRSDWIEHHNQFPIIAGLNDDPEIIKLLAFQCRRLGVRMHNVYACREIKGNRHFRGENTIEHQHEIVEYSKAGLSGLDNHFRLVMSTEYGKMEVLGINDDGEIVLGINRSVDGKRMKRTFIEVDPKKIPDGKFYWLTDEVIECAVSEEGKKILATIKNEKGSFLKSLKRAAALSVRPKTLTAAKGATTSEDTDIDEITIEIVGRNEGSRIVRVNLSDLKDSPTLATVLKKEKAIEAACDEQLSCSTCVAEVTSDGPLPPKTQDEEDVIDASSVHPSSKKGPESSVRATCQIPLKSGSRYKVTPIISV